MPLIRSLILTKSSPFLWKKFAVATSVGTTQPQAASINAALSLEPLRDSALDKMLSLALCSSSLISIQWGKAIHVVVLIKYYC